MVRLNTKLLFYQLLPVIRPAVIYDVGTLDGTHSMRFRRIVPQARMIAFEANPSNVRALEANEPFQSSRIELVRAVVGDRDGSSTFHIEKVSQDESWRKGISSTRQRVSNSLGTSRVEVDSLRLDTFTRRGDGVTGSIAMWIDVEGSSFEVLEGIRAIRDQVVMIHIEVETRELWHGQHLKPDVETLLREMRFTGIARGPLEDQHDLVYLRDDVLATARWDVRWLVGRTWLLTYAQRYLGNTIFRSLGSFYLRRRSSSRQ